MKDSLNVLVDIRTEARNRSMTPKNGQLGVKKNEDDEYL